MGKTYNKRDKTIQRPSQSFFIYRPPSGVSRRRKYQDATKPYKGATEKELSVYYYWWRFLKLNEAYIATCEGNGKGPLAKLYKDFGDVRSRDFATWWKHHHLLFAEPKAGVDEIGKILAREVTVYTPGQKQNVSTLIVNIPLENKVSLTVRQLKKLLEPLVQAKKGKKTESRARYKVGRKPHIPSLYMHLKVWETKLANPAATDNELADQLGIKVNEDYEGVALSKVKPKMEGYDKHLWVVNRRKQLIVQRHLRVARQLIYWVGRGKFPWFAKR